MCLKFEFLRENVKWSMIELKEIGIHAYEFRWNLQDTKIIWLILKKHALCRLALGVFERKNKLYPCAIWLKSVLQNLFMYISFKYKEKFRSLFIVKCKEKWA